MYLQIKKLEKNIYPLIHELEREGLGGGRERERGRERKKESRITWPRCH